MGKVKLTGLPAWGKDMVENHQINLKCHFHASSVALGKMEPV